MERLKVDRTLWHLCMHFGGELVHGSNAPHTVYISHLHWLGEIFAQFDCCRYKCTESNAIHIVEMWFARTRTHNTRRRNKFVIAAHIEKLLSFQLPYLFCIFMSAAMLRRSQLATHFHARFYHLSVSFCLQICFPYAFCASAERTVVRVTVATGTDHKPKLFSKRATF